MKIILTDCATLTYNNDISLDCFKQIGEVVYYQGLTREELLTAAEDTDIILCNKTVIDREVFEAAKKLKYIGLFATGYNNIDIDEARKRGVMVCNAGSYSTNAVAQQTFSYILAHYNAISQYDRFVKEGGWITSPTFSKLCYKTYELADKTIGIIGFGSIGQKVAQLALAFDMKVLVYTRTPKEYANVEFVDFDTLLQKSDIVSVHCPLNPQSEGMFDALAFSKMKDGAFFINTARGGVLSEKALFDALVSEKLSGAAVDVLTDEPMLEDCILMKAPNIILTPHTAWAPIETRNRLIKIVYDNIQGFLSGNVINSVV